MPSPARSTGTTTTSPLTRRPGAGPSGVDDRDGRGRQIPRRFGREQQADADRHPAEQSPGGVSRVAQDRQRVVHERMRHDVNGHGGTIQDSDAESAADRPCRVRMLRLMRERELRVVAGHARRCVRRRSLAAAVAQAQPQQVDLIVYNAIVVTMDAAARVLPRGAVAIRGRPDRRGRHGRGDRGQLTRPRRRSTPAGRSSCRA